MSEHRQPVTALGRAGRDRALQPRGAVAAACCSAPARSRSIPTPARSTATRRREQATRCLRNLEAVCAAAGTTLGDAVRLTVYMTDLGAFAEVNEAYAAFFPADPPARVAIGVVALPRGAQVEIDAVVALPG